MTERIVVRLDPATIEAAHCLDDYDFAVENETVAIPFGVWRQAHRFIIWTNQSPIVDIGDDKLYFLTKHNWTMETPTREGMYWFFGNVSESDAATRDPYIMQVEVYEAVEGDPTLSFWANNYLDIYPEEFEGHCMWQPLNQPYASDEMLQDLKDFINPKDGGTQ